MGKLLKVLGGIFLVVVVLIIGIVVFALSDENLEDSATAYVDATVPVLVGNWDPKELTSRASEELRARLNPSSVEKLYEKARELGRMTAYKGSQGQIRTDVNFPSGKRATARYVAKAEFEKGPATISITLIKNGKKWEISGFHLQRSLISQ